MYIPFGHGNNTQLLVAKYPRIGRRRDDDDDDCGDVLTSLLACIMAKFTKTLVYPDTAAAACPICLYIYVFILYIHTYTVPTTPDAPAGDQWGVCI